MPARIFSAAFADHDHTACCGGALARADARARKAGLRLTPVRRRTLEILLEEHRALGAYDLLDRLAAEGFGHQPPVAYRALDFLVAHGFAHRIRRLNAFAACTVPEKEHVPAFLICSACSAVAELPESGIDAPLQGTAQALGFEISRMNIEALGLCPLCRGKAGAR